MSNRDEIKGSDAHDPAATPGAPIEVELGGLRWPTFAAVVILRGEHDMATAQELDDALGSIVGDVLVDFSECSFCDSSIVRVLFDSQRTRVREGRRLELVVPDANVAIARIFEITGLDSRIRIRRALEGMPVDPCRVASNGVVA